MDNEPSEKIYECGMRRFEVSTLLYELPLLLGALILAWAFLGAFKLLVVDRFLRGDMKLALVMLAGLDVIAIAIVLWAASFYPRRIIVYRDRIRFKMSYRQRDVMFADIHELRPITPADARRALLAPGKLCLSPSVRGAVLMNKAGGRAWVFSPEDPDALMQAVDKARRESAADVSANAPE